MCGVCSPTDPTAVFSSGHFLFSQPFLHSSSVFGDILYSRVLSARDITISKTSYMISAKEKCRAICMKMKKFRMVRTQY